MTYQSRVVKNSIVTLLAGYFFIFLFTTAQADMAPEDPKQYSAGKKTFLHYCARCHGANADGRGKVATMYIKLKKPRPSNFTVGIYAIRPAEYLANVISEGGEHSQLSPYMPPFRDELSKYQIDELVHFIQQTSKHQRVFATHFDN